MFKTRGLPCRPRELRTNGEIIGKDLGDRDLNAVFPGFANNPRQLLGIVKS